jgi:hypothetical protein
MHDTAPEALSHMPSWVTPARAQVLEDVAFVSGAALATLQLVLGRQDMPQTLLRARLVLSAAEACVAFLGRPERAEDLRDAVHLLRPGDLRYRQVDGGLSGLMRPARALLARRSRRQRRCWRQF